MSNQGDAREKAYRAYETAARNGNTSRQTRTRSGPPTLPSWPPTAAPSRPASCTEQLATGGAMWYSIVYGPGPAKALVPGEEFIPSSA